MKIDQRSINVSSEKSRMAFKARDDNNKKLPDGFVGQHTIHED